MAVPFAVVLLLLLAAFSLGNWSYSEQPSRLKASSKSSAVNAGGRAPSLSERAWHRFSPTTLPNFASVRAVKVIFRVSLAGSHYVLAQKKRAHKASKKKHRRWEFPGGKVESFDLIKELIRELGEEDPSGVTAQALKSALKGKRDLYFSLVQLADSRRGDLVLLASLRDNEWKILDQSQAHTLKGNNEVFKYALIPYARLRANGAKWTPRTKKILQRLPALQRVAD